MGKEKVTDEEVNEMSFLDHLEEFRWHLVRSAASIFVLSCAAFILKDFVFNVIILAPKNPEFFTNQMFCKLGTAINIPQLCINSKPFQLISVKMSEQFSTHIVVSIVTGIIISFPYIIWEFWSFLKPALYDKERNSARGAVFYSSVLFMLGVMFGYFLIIPLSIHFLGSYSVSEQVKSTINIRSYISTVTSITFAAGILFELPIVVYFLTKVGLVTPAFLKKYRRHAFILILILSAIITPPDVFSQVMVCFPLFVLYEIGILISRNMIRRQKQQFEEDFNSDEKSPKTDNDAATQESDTTEEESSDTKVEEETYEDVEADIDNNMYGGGYDQNSEFDNDPDGADYYYNEPEDDTKD